jgi:dienelactone hydrolase
MTLLRLARIVAPATLAGVAGCTQPLRLTPDDSPAVLARTSIEAPNPGERGPFTVRTLYYGSGTDRQRAIFRDSVTIRTASVDASKLVTIGKDGEQNRRKFWGFDTKQFPLNARVWYPDGAGPFPLVLVVHGNHDPREFSDPGYAWLGEHLASRGFIVASVDENFLNGGRPQIQQENDARAWMLLKHLERWRAWNDSVAGPFRGRVDMANIALIGHSRGGEAVAHAATFNRLARYPDDARIEFGFGFGIKALIAIAPAEGQYRPAGKLMPLENVSYLVVHGSHDGDVTTFGGLRQYQRIRFTDGKPWFKSAFYVYRANHGQWNTVWGSQDRGSSRTPRQLDVRGLLDPEAQRQFARVIFGGFLEATLRGRREYLPMFRDHRVAGAWLPRTMLITRFEESTFRPIANFEEDVDPATGSVPGVRLAGDSLATWKENTVKFRAGDEFMNTNGVWLGWNNRVAGADTSRRGRPARFTILLPDSLGAGCADASLVLSLAPTREVPAPRAAAGDTAKADAAKATPASRARGRAAPPAPSDSTVPMELTVEMEDAGGRVARLPLSRFGAVRRPLEARVLRRADREKAAFPNTFELVLQTYVLPVSDFARSAAGFDATRVRAIRLVFDRTASGTVVLDDVGFARPDAAFFASRTDR